MRNKLIILLIGMLLSFCGCKKNKTTAVTGCEPGLPTSRVITSRKAIVKLTATATYPVYLLEEGTIDTKLIPCNYPAGAAYYQNDLQVIISGEVKSNITMAYTPCCMESFVITSITK